MDNEDFCIEVGEIRAESKAAANAVRALQEKIRELERDKENLENHIEYLLRSREGSRNESDRDKHFEFALSKADFLEKELKRKEQQYLIDKENWLLERKMLLKSLSHYKGRIKLGVRTTEKLPKNAVHKKEPKKGFNNDSFRPSKLASSARVSVRDIEPNASLYEEKIQVLTEKLRDYELEKIETEKYLEQSQSNFNKSLEVLEGEINVLKRSQNSSDLALETNNLKNIIQEQNKIIEELSFELGEFKRNRGRLEAVKLLQKDSPNLENVPIDILEENIERLSVRYQDLLERTRMQDEKYPELRDELRNTGFDLEYQSFLLYQQKKLREVV